METMTHGSLFSGIGGFDLAAQWAGIENMFQVEIDKFCQKVLAKNFPNTKKYLNIYEFDAKEYRGQIDIISGGFPCQPFSVAGKRQGTQDDRHLWPEMLRVIREIEPSWVIAENVYGLLNIDGGMVFEQVLASLEAINYETQAFIIPAAAVNAPHKRDRVWIIANRESRESGEQAEQKGWENISGGNIFTANTRDEGLQRDERTGTFEQGERASRSTPERNWDENWIEVATRLCRMDDGIPNRVDRLKSLGNAIVPQIAYEIFKSIILSEESK